MKNASTAADIVARIRAATNTSADQKLALHEPWFCGNERTYVLKTIDDNWVSSAGEFVEKFERDLAKFCDVKCAVAVSNGTVALHAAFIACGIERDDEIIIPSLTFVATANAVMHAGAQPHFVDCDPARLSIDPNKLRVHLNNVSERKNGATYNKQTGRKIAALCPVSIFGIPADLDALQSIADDFDLILIQDAAEALGSTINGRSVFKWGKCAGTSFNGNKIITSGGGGAILTDDEDLAKRLKHLTTTAKRPHPYEFYHDEVAFNYRMPNINAALAAAQLEQMPKFLELKKNLLDRYVQAFAGCNAATLLRAPHGTQSNNWLNGIVLQDASGRDDVLKYLNDNHIHARPIWNLMHTLPMYQKAFAADLSASNDMAARVINIPSSAILGVA
ncbi:MAG TPA: LegC family aminotransferase [Alphaproteobacteria bacterium]